MTASPERILRFGRLRTFDPGRPEARAVGVRGGRIVAIGTLDEVASALSPSAPVIDAGETAVPGFRDAHTHAAAGSEELTRLDLRDAGSAAEIADRVRVRAAAFPEGSWIRGWGWDLGTSPERWPGPEVLDEAAPRHPVFLVRIDGHVAWFNRAAAVRLGAGGRGGHLVEAAKERAEAAIPPLARPARLRALEATLAAAAERGLTAIDDMIPVEAFDLYRELAARGDLPLRVRVWFPAGSIPSPGGRVASERLEIAGQKLFLDGTLGSRTAALLDPYDDAPDTSGEIRLRTDAFRSTVLEADAAGWDLAVHAIGDRAVREALDAFAALPDLPRRRGHRIEHAQIVDPADLPRFAAIGVVASLQPLHRRLDAPWLPARVGALRAARSVPVRSLLAAEARVLFGTDWPVAPIDPAATVEAACEPGPESIDRAVALRVLGGGPLAVGAPADFTVLRSDATAPIRVAATIVGGEIVPRRVDTLFDRRLHSGDRSEDPH